MTSNVEVVQVETVKAGKTDRIVLHYKAERTKGDTWTVGALAVKLDEASRKKVKEIENLMPEKDFANKVFKGASIPVSARIVKEGQYYNLASVGDPEVAGNTRNSTTQYTTNSTQAGRLSDVEKAEGQQRGNVLTNAVTVATAVGYKSVYEALNLVEEATKGLMTISNKLSNTEDTDAETNNLNQSDELDQYNNSDGAW